MDSHIKLPGFLSLEMEKRGTKPEEIIAFAKADMNTECVYIDTYLLLTDKKVIFAVAEPSALKQHVFTGYYDPKKEKHKILEKKGLQNDCKIAEVHYFELEKIDELKAENLVAGGMLTIKYEGVEKALCMFNNYYMRQISKFVELFNKVKKGETLTEDDYKENKDEQRCPKCGMLYPDQERKICAKCMDRRSLFIRMLAYFKPYKKTIAIMLFCVLFGTSMSLIAPYLSGTVLLDKVLNKNEGFLAQIGLKPGSFVLALVLLVLMMFVTKFLQQFLQIVQGRIVAKVVPMVMYKIKTNIFESLGRLSLSFFSKKQTGSLMTRINSDSNEVLFFFIDGLPYVFTNLFFIIMSCVIMFVMNWKLAIMSVILLPVLFMITFNMVPVFWHYYGKRHRSVRSLNTQINDNLTGARVVKAFGQESTEIKRFDRVNSRVRTAEMDLVSYDNKIFAWFVIVEQLAYFAVWIAGAYLVLGGKNLGYGTLVTFLGYVGMLSGPMDFLSYALRWWSSSMNSAQRIFEILDTMPEVVESKTPVAMNGIQGNIEIKNVKFSYEPNKPILQDVSFSVSNGQMLGIVGHSGAGKTTLVNLISRLYDVNEGEILIDNVNVKDISFKDLRGSIGMVSQETYIFMGSIAENIAYAKPDASTDEIVQAAMAASAHDFIMKLQDGYNTQVGAGGRQLSGGERQRISIARAILSNPKILILDEATASVDTETEKRIQEAIDTLVVGRTTISIAHRLSTLRNATKLIVMENGKITEQGTHLELAKQKGTYYKLMQLQSKALAVRGVGED